MRHVKSEYEMCSKRYQNTMSKISQTATNVDQQQQQLQQQRNATAAAAAAAASDGVDGIKAVCW